MKIYYETAHYETGSEYPTTTAHDDFESAAEFADAHGIETIQQIGGAWDEFCKCWFCGEWFPGTEINDAGTCDRCAVAIRDHG